MQAPFRTGHLHPNLPKMTETGVQNVIVTLRNIVEEDGRQ
jgi:hypothetical protein